MEQINGSMIADSPDAVRMRVREQLMLGATQIKLTAGGGVASPHSPIDVSTFTEPELRAAVEAAENWDTYVTVHAYTPTSIRRAIAAGVKVIEHGHLMDEAAAKLMAEKEIWLSIQPFLDDEDAVPFPPNSPNRAQQLEVIAGTDRAYALAKKYKLKTAFGTDVLFSEALAKRQGAQLAKLVRWYTPAEALKQATENNAELLTLSGKRNRYPGKLGVVEEGALADLLLVDGNPLENLDLIAHPERNFRVIMKDFALGFRGVRAGIVFGLAICCGLLLTLALSPHGQAILFPLGLNTVVMATIGHVIYGATLGSLATSAPRRHPASVPAPTVVSLMPRANTETLVKEPVERRSA
jgi:imidazolonepropionase-like amidohydrolase